MNATNESPAELYTAVLDALPAQLDTQRPNDALLTLIRLAPYRALWLEHDTYVMHDASGYRVMQRTHCSAAYVTARAALQAALADEGLLPFEEVRV